ncbi:MAG: uracil-DNA glycosylase family protein, partial [Cyanobacteria bacterium]|nr:uracil-DNA glycosylase family protein [Cyanobacteriota bacterium]
KPVFQIHPQAKILIIGQAPGIRVQESGVPFQDASGDRLRAWMGVDAKMFYDATQIAIMPMGFCYPGTGKTGDLPPRKECAPLWHPQLLAGMPEVQLTLLVGQYAQERYLKPEFLKAGNLDTPAPTSLTERVQNWKAYWPQYLPLPHPSPRNNIWLKKNQWFEAEVIPALQECILKILTL